MVVRSDNIINCGPNKECPEDFPCCSQYGQCGTGAYCLGGCDIRYSYNLTSCMPMPIIDEYQATFDNKDLFENQYTYLGNSSESDWVYSGNIDINDDAVLLQMPNQSTGTVISSTKYLFYGKVSATLKTSHDKGVITAFILYSDVQDEIDFEFVGYNLTSPQTNFYAQGILNYTNARNSTTSDTFANYHDYEIDWNHDRIIWSVDGDPVRQLNRNDTFNSTTHRYDYPQTPSRVQFSLWPGGSASGGLGTIEWAGGEIDWNSQDIQQYGYYYAYLKNITITPYDLNLDLEEVHSDDGTNSFDAYLYNSTDGNENDIYLTNKKTWLGNDGATGLDPDNDSDSEESLSASHNSTRTSHSSVNVPTAASGSSTTGTANGGGNGGGNAATTTDYHPDDGIGGFIQDTKATETVTVTAGSHPSAASKPYVGFWVLLSLVLGGVSFIV